jgi:cation transport protein ChaC
MWNPGFNFVSCRRAVVKGFLRRFWNKSGDHRGTPDANGLVVSLIDAQDLRGHSHENDMVTGLVYEIEENSLDDILRDLDIREKYGYIRGVTSAFCADSGSHLGECFVYTACFDPSIDVFLRPADGVDNSASELEFIASVIRFASGPSGSNFDYLKNLRKALDSHGFVDSHVEELYNLCTMTNRE